MSFAVEACGLGLLFNVRQPPARLYASMVFLFAARRSFMERDYDLFEVLPDGGVIWRETVSGHENAIRRLKELSQETSNEVRVMHVLSNTLIASMNGPEE
jgi:hypothetical protein